MLIKKNANKTNKSRSLRKNLLCMAFYVLPFTQVSASELNVEHYTVSQGAIKQDLNEQRRKTIIETNRRVNIPDQLNGKATAKTRLAILNSQKEVTTKLKSSTAPQNSNNVSLSQDYYADFTIYGATSFLEEDYDGDGFYQTFSVVFDADIYSENQMGEVYALLYIRKNGGPWTHYFTTDNFIIEGDTDQDEYEVITTFLSGYSADYYDVLIDLYQEGYSDIVATYSSDDSNALYALSLESADYDEVYIEPYIEVVEISGGSFSVVTLLIILISFVFRFKNKHL